MEEVRARLFASAFGLSVALGLASPVQAEEKPRYGGTLQVATMNRQLALLTWDPADWNWKVNHDTGQFPNELFSGDLSKSKRNGGKYPFYADALASVQTRCGGELGRKLGV